MLNRLTKAAFCSVLIALTFSFHVCGQPLNPGKQLNQYNIDWFGEDKIPAGILTMIQTHDGYLWMGTHDYLIRFDGVNVSLYNRLNTPEFKINGFRSLYEDKRQNLWLGSDGGGLFLKRKTSYKKFEIPFGASSNYVLDIFEDSKNNLWLGTMRGLVLFKDSTFTLISPSSEAPKAGITIFDIAEDKEGNVWAASSIGVLKYANGELKEYTWPGVAIKGEIMSIHIDSRQNIWIGSYGNGVFKATPTEIKKVIVLGTFGRTVRIMEDRNHLIWIGTESGVARCGENSISVLGATDGLSNVNAICEDHEGSVWLGTYYNGVARLRDGTFTNYSRSNGLPHNTVHCISQTRDSTIWVGTETNLAYYKNGKFTKSIFPELSDARIRDIYPDSNNNLWIATYDGLFNLKNNKLKRYTTADGLSSDRVRLIFEDRQKRLWIGTRRGLNVYEHGKWKSFSEKDGLLNDFIMSVIQLNNDSLVIGTNSGIFYYNGKTFKSLITDKEYIGSAIFRTYQDKEGYIWIGTGTGLLCVKDKKLYSYKNENNLLGGVIFQIIEDHLGMMWLTSSGGIIRISRKELIDHQRSSSSKLNPQLFSKSSGTRAKEVTGTSKGMIAFDKRIWFPTLQGVEIVDPTNIVFNKVPPPIAIEDVMVDGVGVDTSAPITVKPGSKNIEIHYSAMSFMAPEKVQFRYLLKGYDDAWHEAYERRAAYYTSLPPGDYTFILEACNNDNVWNRKENALQLHVEKAFWQTWTFYISAFLLAILAAYGIASYRIRNIKELNRKLDERIKERTREVMQQKEEIESQRDFIEVKNHELEKANNIIAQQYEKLQEVNENLEHKVRERTRDLLNVNEELDYFIYKSSHDIKGPLARLHGLANLALMETNEKATKEYLAILQHESILANRVIQKLSYAHQIKNMEVAVLRIKFYDLLEEIIGQLTILHPTASHIKFTLDLDRNLELHSDSRLVKELFVNVLENTIVFQSANDQKVTVRAKVIDGILITSVSDNGVGINDQAKPGIFKMFYKGSEKSLGLGLGLFIARRATEKINGSIILVSSQPGATEFEIRMPVLLQQPVTKVEIVA